MGDIQASSCILKAEHMTCKITTTSLGCLFNLKLYTFMHFSTATVKCVVNT